MSLQKRMRLFKFMLVVGSVGVNKKCPTYDSIFLLKQPLIYVQRNDLKSVNRADQCNTCKGLSISIYSV